MEDRLRLVETAVINLKNDFKLLNQTLAQISETLKELKENNSQLHIIEKHLVAEDGDIHSLKSQVRVLFKFKDEMEVRTRLLEKSDISKTVKIGGAETIYTIIATAIVGAVVTFFKWGN